MYRPKTTFFIAAIVCICTISAFAADRELDIEGKYLNLPVSEKADKCLISFKVEDEKVREFVIKLAPGKPDYWVYLEVQDFVGKRGELVTWEISERQIKKKPEQSIQGLLVFNNQ